MGPTMQGMESVLLPLQGSFARQFAQEWIEAWNGHDLERILDHYDDEVVLLSPVALSVLGNGLVEGKAALRDYFRRGLEAYPNLRFDLFEVLWGIETVVVVYKNNVRNSKAAEVMQLSAAGKVTRVWANYDR
jgi:ketosteroid isomerase-like protein